jgi:hypothetical protein
MLMFTLELVPIVNDVEAVFQLIVVKMLAEPEENVTLLLADDAERVKLDVALLAYALL